MKKYKQSDVVNLRISEAEENTTLLTHSKVERSTKSSRYHSPEKDSEKSKIRATNLTNESQRK